MLARKSVGKNASIHDVRTRINTHLLHPEFNKIQYPYRSSMLTKYVGPNKIEKLPKYGNYPDFLPLKETGGEEMVMRSLLFFAEMSKLPEGANVRIDACRYLHNTHIPNDWYLENYEKKGVLCIRKEGVDATYQVRKKMEQNAFIWKVDPGEFLIMEEGGNTLQQFQAFFIEEDGYLDLLTFIY